MPKTAQQWMEILNLEELPDPELLEALNALEGKEVIGRATDPAESVRFTPDDIAAAVNAGSVGDALRRMRERSGLTTREAGERLSLSHARVTQMEGQGDSLNLNTVSRTARRLGYHVKLVFEPEDGGPSITALLTGA